jgi:molybdopterin/thiamine biosynthesis adenylyltransferase
MPEDLKAFLLSAAMGGLVDWQSYETARHLFGVSYPDIEQVVLEQGLFPKRYAAQRQFFQPEGQLKLCRARVAIVGCGGLGSCLVEMLARAGIGTLQIIDPDVFVESNLNRQFLCTVDSLGRLKVEVAAERVARINPAVTVISLVEALNGENGVDLLAGMNVVVDALDSIPARRELGHVCRKMNLPLVHGAVAGWYGQVAVQRPSDDLVSRLYSHPGQPEMEMPPDNFSAGVAAVASLQVVLVVKVLLDVEPLPANGWFSFDLREVDLERIDF